MWRRKFIVAFIYNTHLINLTPFLLPLLPSWHSVAQNMEVSLDRETKQHLQHITLCKKDSPKPSHPVPTLLLHICIMAGDDEKNCSPSCLDVIVPIFRFLAHHLLGRMIQRLKLQEAWAALASAKPKSGVCVCVSSWCSMMTIIHSPRYMGRPIIPSTCNSMMSMARTCLLSFAAHTWPVHQSTLFLLPLKVHLEHNNSILTMLSVEGNELKELNLLTVMKEEAQKEWLPSGYLPPSSAACTRLGNASVLARH